MVRLTSFSKSPVSHRHAPIPPPVHRAFAPFRKTPFFHPSPKIIFVMTQSTFLPPATREGRHVAVPKFVVPPRTAAVSVLRPAAATSDLSMPSNVWGHPEPATAVFMVFHPDNTSVTSLKSSSAARGSVSRSPPARPFRPGIFAIHSTIAAAAGRRPATVAFRVAC